MHDVIGFLGLMGCSPPVCTENSILIDYETESSSSMAARIQSRGQTAISTGPTIFLVDAADLALTAEHAVIDAVPVDAIRWPQASVRCAMYAEVRQAGAGVHEEPGTRDVRPGAPLRCL
jgi:hypothetical protein